MSVSKNQIVQKEVLKCAKKLFLDIGYCATSIRTISKTMGWASQSSFYNYFESKEVLANRVFGDYFERLNNYVLKKVSLEKTDPLVLLTLREILNCEVIILDKAQRRMLEESIDSITVVLMRQYAPDYVDLINKNTKNLFIELSEDDLYCGMIYYITGFAKVLITMDTGVVQIDLEKFAKRLPYIFLDLIGTNYDQRNSIVKEARLIFDTIPKKDLKKLKLL